METEEVKKIKRWKGSEYLGVWWMYSSDSKYLTKEEIEKFGLSLEE